MSRLVITCSLLGLLVMGSAWCFVALSSYVYPAPYMGARWQLGCSLTVTPSLPTPPPEVVVIGNPGGDLEAAR